MDEQRVVASANQGEAYRFLSLYTNVDAGISVHLGEWFGAWDEPHDHGAHGWSAVWVLEGWVESRRFRRVDLPGERLVRLGEVAPAELVTNRKPPCVVPPGTIHAMRGNALSLHVYRRPPGATSRGTRFVRCGANRYRSESY